MVSTLKTLSTVWSVFTRDGLTGVAKVSCAKAGMWWRQGDPLEFRKYLGRPSALARLDSCRFDLAPAIVSAELKAMLISGQHEASERRLVKRYVDPALPLVELGGALGVISCIANRRLRVPDRHVVVEANPALIPILLSNRNRNGCRFSVLNRVLAYDRQATPFYVNDDDVLSSSLHRPGGRPVAVPSTTLSEVLDSYGYERCTLVCDVEGSEVDLVRHELQTLAQRVSLLIVEVHDRIVGLDAVSRMLGDLGEAGFTILERAWETVALRNRRW